MALPWPRYCVQWPYWRSGSRGEGADYSGRRPSQSQWPQGDCGCSARPRICAAEIDGGNVCENRCLNCSSILTLTVGGPRSLALYTRRPAATKGEVSSSLLQLLGLIVCSRFTDCFARPAGVPSGCALPPPADPYLFPYFLRKLPRRI